MTATAMLLRYDDSKTPYANWVSLQEVQCLRLADTNDAVATWATRAVIRGHFAAHLQRVAQSYAARALADGNRALYEDIVDWLRAFNPDDSDLDLDEAQDSYVRLVRRR